jgi:acetylornithine deacetylase/succinyl-diaminopimelate desuccinylase-like protein
MRAIASLTDERGTVAVAGFHDEVRAPTPPQIAAAARIPLPTAAVELPGGVRPYWPGDDAELRQRLVFAPALSVAEMSVGADGVGSVPASASATVRFSLVPDQEPERVQAAVEAHLAACGFADVQVTAGRSILPAAAPLDTPFAEATIAAARDVFGEPVVYPVLIGAGPGRTVLDLLGAPVVSPAGTLRPDGNMHGPDEHGAIADYLDHVRFTARLFDRLAASGF